MLDPENIPYDVIERDKARRYEVVNKSRRLEKRASGFTIHIDETSATFLFLGVYNWSDTWSNNCSHYQIIWR